MAQTSLDHYFGTSFHLSGNRYIDISATCGGLVPRSFQAHEFSSLSSEATWIVGGTATSSPFIYSKDGSMGQWNVAATSNGAASWTQNSPRIVNVASSQPWLLDSTSDTAVPTPDGGVLMVDNNKLIHRKPSGEEKIFSEVVDPMHDSRIAVSTTDEKTRYALYAGETDDRYTHCIMGDCLEGSTLVVLEWNENSQELSVVLQINDLLSDGDAVYEGLGPMWTGDIDANGVGDLLTTVSKSGGGAQLRAYLLKDDGQLALKASAQSEYIGSSARWRHQLAAGPFGANGEFEIWNCQTPHIGGIIQAHRLSNPFTGSYQLTKVASTSAYTTHAIGSRNLDTALVGDFNGNGRFELAVQTQSRDTLVGLERTEVGFKEVWRVSNLPGRLTSNIAATCDVGGGSVDIWAGASPNLLVHASFLPSAQPSSLSPTSSPTVVNDSFSSPPTQESEPVPTIGNPASGHVSSKGSGYSPGRSHQRNIRLLFPCFGLGVML